jgi:hypothetical protein
MKRIALAYTLWFLCSWSLTATDTPASTWQAVATSPPLCSMSGIKGAEITPEPLFKTSIPPPCYAYTQCPDGSSISCPNVSNDSYCWSSDGCWVDCGQDGFLFCPGRRWDPECAIW